MLIKSQDGNMLFNFGGGCLIDIRPTIEQAYVRAYSNIDSGYIFLGEYPSAEHAQEILNDIFDSYNNGEKCFDMKRMPLPEPSDAEVE